jgi:PAS domain
MEGRAVKQAKFCALHTIAELERLLGFGAGARVIRRVMEHCQSSSDGCSAPFDCPERLATASAAPAAEPIKIAVPAPGRSPAELSPCSAEIIPLAAIGRGQTVSDDLGNFIERRRLGIDVALARGDMLADLVHYWQALKGGEAVPLFGDIDPVRLAQLGVLGRMHVLNAENPDPAKMRFDLYGNKVALDNGRVYTGVAIGDHPVRLFAETVAADYDDTRRTAEPHYFRVRKRLGGVGYRYARLALPFSADGRRVDRILVAIRPEPDDGVSLNR